MAGLHRRRWSRWTLLSVVFGGAAFYMGCGSSVFTPAFVDLVDDSGESASVDPAEGFVVLSFVNNAEVSERLVTYLASADGGGLVLTDAEKRALRPRIRFRVEVTYTNGSTKFIEFISGSSKLIEAGYDATAFADLNQNDLNNEVLLCGVESITLDADRPVEVFMPVEMSQYRQVETTDDQGAVIINYQLQGVTVPQFRPLVVDTVDEDGNTILQSNIGVRDTAAPVTNPACGSVVAIVLNGVLTAPFLTDVDPGPSYDINDAQTVASIGGRYEFAVSIQ
jgi:hypothetical protein